MKNKDLKILYLAFMIVASLLPLFLATPHLQTYGLSPLVFIQQSNATSAAAACFADLTLSAIVFLVFVWFDLKKRNAPKSDFWISVLLLPIGVVTSIAFYLYRRERT